jgi:hypothetical protein
MKRILFSVDPKSNWIMLAGLLQLVPALVLIHGSFATFPPDLSVWWNLPVPKGGRPGVGAFLVLAGITILLLWHSVGLILRSRKAILIAGLPYVGMAIYGIVRRIEYVRTHDIVWNERFLMDVTTSLGGLFITLSVVFAALRILVDILDERKKSSVDVQVA